ncbi:MAG: SWIM zinc finger family protein [Phormidium sp.]
MAGQSKTWWGQKFIKALESFCDPNRLKRGRSYANPRKIINFERNKGDVLAHVRGSVNPYFGVYKEPLYKTEVKISPIPKKDWTKIIQKLSTNASFVSRLLLNEIPENIEECFEDAGYNFLPYSSQDFKTDCTCPDWSNPCKHIAGVCYLLAEELDNDPFLLFELRGLTRDALQKELMKSPLGKALASGLVEEDIEPEPVDSYYTIPKTKAVPDSVSLKEFWLGSQRIPETPPSHEGAQVSGIVVKKQGDNPAFWDSDRSFLETMDEIYERVRNKYKNVF